MASGASTEPVAAPTDTAKTLKANASPSTTERFGVSSLELELHQSKLVFRALDDKGTAVTEAHFEGLELTTLDPQPDEVKNTVLNPAGHAPGKQQKTSIKGRFGTINVDENGLHGAGGVDSSKIIDELSAYGADLHASAHSSNGDGIQAEATVSQVMNGICYVAGIGTAFWPIGTLIFGPTALGCAIYYFAFS
jgi:hypothetical protein